MLLLGEPREWFIYNRVIFKPKAERELSSQIIGILLIHAEAFQCARHAMNYRLCGNNHCNHWPVSLSWLAHL